MKFRWSNGHSRSIEFECDQHANFEKCLLDGLIDYRSIGNSKKSRLELHVHLPNRDLWINPYTDEGRTHVIHLLNHDPDPQPTKSIIRGTDYVLIIGPSDWHSSAVWNACKKSIKIWGSNNHGFDNDQNDDVSPRPVSPSTSNRIKFQLIH